VDTSGSLPQGSEQVDISSVAFARRMANLLLATRRERRVSIGRLARHSGGRFSKRDLRAWEAGERPLDAPTVLQLTGLYGCDVSQILPLRLPIAVEFGRISAGGVSAPFEPLSSTSLLEAYLRLVRSLRRQKSAPTVELRRDDIEVLAAYLQEKGEVVVERLGALMGATRSQRTAMAGLFATGAVVIGLVGTAAAGGPSPATGTGTLAPGDRAPSLSDQTSTTMPELLESKMPISVPVIVVAGDVGISRSPDASETGASSLSSSSVSASAAAGTASASDSSTSSEVPLVDTDLPTEVDPVVEVGVPPLP
jgi:hypothetical protein